MITRKQMQRAAMLVRASKNMFEAAALFDEFFRGEVGYEQSLFAKLCEPEPLDQISTNRWRIGNFLICKIGEWYFINEYSGKKVARRKTLESARDYVEAFITSSAG